jgi:hypothetical protein
MGNGQHLHGRSPVRLPAFTLSFLEKQGLLIRDTVRNALFMDDDSSSEQRQLFIRIGAGPDSERCVVSFIAAITSPAF